MKTIADETLPLVESVTGLPLPDPVVIRLMRPRAWCSAHARMRRQLLMAESAEFSIPWRDLAGISAALKAGNKERRRTWPLIGALCAALTPDEPEMIVLPQSLREGGVLDSESFLFKTVAHEATHLAQYAASEGKMWAAQDTLFPHLRGTADRDYQFLVEGHAHWADHQVTTKILGAPAPTDGLSPHASSRFRALQDSLRGSGTREFLDRATSSVGDIIAEHGLDNFNQVWASPDLVPTTDEKDDPAAWLARFVFLRSA
ncbi:zinc-dependent metalloprotease [Streptomyces sp. GQFP]|uniref:zinc-dependent metalloprotease n=1 Tax=Streptomyces sp. GQFP TaxID=2907545 RepID=UPI001F1AC5CA|nr:zinc-dependent metalloprotease [Streptomyces sp. GQFP]UIX34267.1 zinc-dependent metalloprotease [Streptomyces sp. GQFP]